MLWFSLMTSNEQINPPFYDDLYNGYSQLVMSQGTEVTIDPTELMAGLDGSVVVPADESFVTHQYERSGEDLSIIIRALGIESVGACSFQCPDVEVDHAPEMINGNVQVGLLELGVYKYLTLTKFGNGIITAICDIQIPADEDYPAPALEELSEQEKNEIFLSILMGEEGAVAEEGPRGDFARATLRRVMNSDPAEHLGLFRTVLAEL